MGPAHPSDIRASLPGTETRRLSQWRRCVLWCLACLFNGLNRRLEHTWSLLCSLDRAVQLVCHVCGHLHAQRRRTLCTHTSHNICSVATGFAGMEGVPAVRVRTPHHHSQPAGSHRRFTICGVRAACNAASRSRNSIRMEIRSTQHHALQYGSENYESI